jgi:glutathione S-transferase
MSVKLYFNTFSNNAIRARIALEEKKVDHEVVHVDIFNGEARSEAYINEVNPRGQVPTLVDGDVKVVESVAIMEYIERVFDGPPLLPTSNADLALCLNYLSEFHQKLDNKNFFFSATFGGKSKEELQPQIDALRTELNFWNQHLKDKEWLANTFSMADIAVYTIMIVFRVLGMDFDKEFPNIGRWMTAMEERPSVNKNILRYEDYPRVIKFNTEFTRGEFPKYLAEV